jgi:hypothetical protein
VNATRAELGYTCSKLDYWVHARSTTIVTFSDSSRAANIHANPGFLMNLIFFALGCECSSQESGRWISVQVLVLMACLCLASTFFLLLLVSNNSTKRTYMHTLLIPKTVTFSLPVTNITPRPSKKHTCMCEAARPSASKAKPDLIASHFCAAKLCQLKTIDSINRWKILMIVKQKIIQQSLCTSDAKFCLCQHCTLGIDVRNI